jgi:hypothetical protein
VATAIAVAVLVAGCGGSGDAAPDGYSAALNRLCSQARQKVAQAARAHGKQLEEGDPAPLAQSVFTAIGHLHVALGKETAPADQIARGVEFEQVELEEEKPIIDLIHFPSIAAAHADIGEVASLDARMQRLGKALEAEDCGRLAFAQVFSSF